MDSSIINDLISIISNFDFQERHVFVQFITGSPKLFLGGFKTLKPKLTIVLKHVESGLTPNEYLPSVMMTNIKLNGIFIYIITNIILRLIFMVSCFVVFRVEITRNVIKVSENNLQTFLFITESNLF